MTTPSLRAARPANPLKGAPPAAGQSPFRGGRLHGLLRGPWSNFVRPSLMPCRWRASAVDE